MARMPILRYPDPRLYRKAVPVERVDDSVRKLVDDMAETMYSAPGIGLAATQVDVHKRVIVIDASETRDRLLVLINPEIVSRDGTQLLEEGCLSLPGIYEAVERALTIRVKALDREGRRFEREASELLSVCIQHEIDHLEGKVFVDYLSRLKRDRIRARLQKQLKKTA
jgi:peptide deformylase